MNNPIETTYCVSMIGGYWDASYYVSTINCMVNPEKGKLFHPSPRIPLRIQNHEQRTPHALHLWNVVFRFANNCRLIFDLYRIVGPNPETFQDGFNIVVNLFSYLNKRQSTCISPALFGSFRNLKLFSQIYIGDIAFLGIRLDSHRSHSLVKFVKPA